jgi:hypothetical protein
VLKNNFPCLHLKEKDSCFSLDRERLNAEN